MRSNGLSAGFAVFLPLAFALIPAAGPATAAPSVDAEAQLQGEFSAPACDAPDAAFANHHRAPPVVDMTRPNDAVPHDAVTPAGKPFSWALHARVWRGNAPQAGWTSIISTAMVYAPQSQPVSTGVRVEVRDLQLYVQRRTTGSWCLLDRRMMPNGALFHEDFAGDASLPPDRRPEADGGISVRLIADHNFHFWGNKLPLPAGGIDGVYTQYEARIVPDTDGDERSVAHARYIAAASADYWVSQNAASGHVLVNNEDAAIGRFKSLSSHWQLITMNSNGGTPLAPQSSPPSRN